MSSFRLPFNKTILPGFHDGVATLSDGEPDDDVALFIINKQLTTNGNNVRQLWITGEGREKKLLMFKQQAAAMPTPPTNITFAQSALSGRDYPPEMTESFIDLCTAQDDGAGTALEYDAVLSLRQFLESCENPLVVVIKPFPELLAMPSALLAKTTVAIYGSFNFRCMFDSVGKENLASFINNSFLRVILYETYFVLDEDNSINNVNAPRFYETICQIGRAHV